ncbi:MAG: RNA 2'-phosphotransferase, partial [Dongiaceae bacterium]
MDRVQLSKFLSYVLRHRPDSIGLGLEEGGWAGVGDLLSAAARHGKPIALADLIDVVASNDKRRFAFSPDRRRIRAVQGHSVAVELGYAPATPPDRLYHGTVERFIESIRAEGLKRGRRHHVHLSADRETASKVGTRRGAPVVL